MQALSLYIHIPWCIKKCPYCDFNSHTVKAELPETAYIDALLADLDADIARYAVTQPIRSIFIGGGTPSLFSPETLARLLDGIRRRVVLMHDLEITLEANPGTFESAKFKEFNALGINRLSIGIQSFNDGLLAKLGRVHSGKEAAAAVEIARNAGFSNLNLDFMFGLPGAKSGDSVIDIAHAISLEPTHISLYQLTLEPNTWFHKFPPTLPDDDFIVSEQQRCQSLLSEHGYAQYEISAYSKTGKQCRHNLNYWEFGDYLGIGAGAHGKITVSLPGSVLRSAKTKSPETYMANPIDANHQHPINTTELPLEFVMNHLRLRRGFTLTHFRTTTGLSDSALQPGLSECEKLGLVELHDDHYVCSEKGWNYLDSVLEKFVPD